MQHILKCWTKIKVTNQIIENGFDDIGNRQKDTLELKNIFQEIVLNCTS